MRMQKKQASVTVPVRRTLTGEMHLMPKTRKEAVLDTSKELTGIHHAQINIKDYSEIQVELDADTASITVTIVKLAQEGFYDGLTFHRIMDGYMVQGGDPLGNGTGGSDENIKGEFSNNGVENNISHTRGVISMARAMDPDSASSSFLLCTRTARSWMEIMQDLVM